MKKIFLLLLFCLPFLLFGQRYVKGRVVDAETKKPIFNAEVRIGCSDGTAITVHTDSNGFYIINLEHFLPKTCYIIYAKKRDPFYESVQYDRITTALGNIIDTATENFWLSRLFHMENHTPATVFLKNSVMLSQGMKDTALDYMYCILKVYPICVIEIDGHADSKEKNPVELSLKRAQVCKAYFVSKGIDSMRIAVKGWGCSRPLIHRSEIRKVKTETAKDSLSQPNRRIVFQFISWDYAKK